MKRESVNLKRDPKKSLEGNRQRQRRKSNLRDTVNRMRMSNKNLIGVTGGDDKENGKEALFKKIVPYNEGCQSQV